MWFDWYFSYSSRLVPVSVHKSIGIPLVQSMVNIISVNFRRWSLRNYLSTSLAKFLVNIDWMNKCGINFLTEQKKLNWNQYIWTFVREKQKQNKQGRDWCNGWTQWSGWILYFRPLVTFRITAVPKQKLSGGRWRDHLNQLTLPQYSGPHWTHAIFYSRSPTYQQQFWCLITEFSGS